MISGPVGKGCKINLAHLLDKQTVKIQNAGVQETMQKCTLP